MNHDGCWGLPPTTGLSRNGPCGLGDPNGGIVPLFGLAQQPPAV